MTISNGLLEVGDVVVVETLQTGVVVAIDTDTDVVHFRHDEDGEAYRVARRLVRHLRPGEPRLGGHR